MKDDIDVRMIEYLDPARDLSDDQLSAMFADRTSMPGSRVESSHSSRPNHYLDLVSRTGLSAKPRSTRTTRRARVEVSLVAAGVVGIALVAGVLAGEGMDKSGKSAPTLALAAGTALQSGSVHRSVGSSSPLLPYTAAFVPGPSLSSTSQAMPAYELSWPSTATASVNQLSAAFGVTSSTQRSLALGGVVVGPADGPSIEVDPVVGHLRWSFEASPSVRSSGGQETSDSVAVSSARGYLASIGMDGTDNGTPQVSNFGDEVGVIIPVTINGVPTSLESEFVFGPNDTLRMASGILVDLTESARYPTMSALSAVSALDSQTHYGRIDAVSKCGSPPVCTGTIDSANLEYRPFASASGQQLLLPVWILGSTNPGSSDSIGGWVVAIPSSSIQLQDSTAP